MSWQDMIRERVARRAGAAPIEDLERIATSCAEALMGELNVRLDRHRLPTIPFEKVMDQKDEAGLLCDVGIYQAIVSLVAEQMYRHVKRSARPDAQLLRALDSIAGRMMDEDRMAMMEHFMDRHPQLRLCGIDDGEALFDLVKQEVDDLSFEALTGKPFIPIEKPPSGRTR